MRTYTPADMRSIPAAAKKVFTGQIFDVYQWPQTMFDGASATFEMIKRPDTIEVLCLVADKLVILYQQQPGTDFYYDLPSGRHDVESESELAAAKREVLEETGRTFAHWHLIECKQPDPKIDRLIYTFVAWGQTSQQAPHLDNGEKISEDLYFLPDAIKLIPKSNAKFIGAQFWKDLESFEQLKELPDLYDNRST